MGVQTAVECLIKELRQLALNTSHHLGMGDIKLTQGMLDDFEEKYKEIEKVQILDAILLNQKGLITREKILEAKKYYNETFKQNT